MKRNNYIGIKLFFFLCVYVCVRVCVCVCVCVCRTMLCLTIIRNEQKDMIREWIYVVSNKYCIIVRVFYNVLTTGGCDV